MKKVLKSFLSINPVSITGFLILLILILFLTGIPILEPIELKTYDLRLVWRGEKKSSLKVERVSDGKTTPSAVFLKRCQQFKDTPPVPPGQKYDGVFRLNEK